MKNGGGGQIAEIEPCCAFDMAVENPTGRGKINNGTGAHGARGMREGGREGHLHRLLISGDFFNLGEPLIHTLFVFSKMTHLACAAWG